MGHMAEAIMTKSFINPRAKKYFKEKEEVSMFFVFVFFVDHIFVARFSIEPLRMV